jgi:hypothetical protein
MNEIHRKQWFIAAVHLCCASSPKVALLSIQQMIFPL